MSSVPMREGDIFYRLKNFNLYLSCNDTNNIFIGFVTLKISIDDNLGEVGFDFREGSFLRAFCINFNVAYEELLLGIFNEFNSKIIDLSFEV